MNQSKSSVVPPVSRRREFWVAYLLLSGLTILLVLLGVALKLALAPSVLTYISPGQSCAAVIQTLGALVLTSTVLFAMPRTAVLGPLS